ncbi:hypothetical protein ACLOJK_018827 [Asimina triloba]
MVRDHSEVGHTHHVQIPMTSYRSATVQIKTHLHGRTHPASMQESNDRAATQNCKSGHGLNPSKMQEAKHGRIGGPFDHGRRPSSSHLGKCLQ